jgi:hypothetical protein
LLPVAALCKYQIEYILLPVVAVAAVQSPKLQRNAAVGALHSCLLSAEVEVGVEKERRYLPVSQPSLSQPRQ